MADKATKKKKAPANGKDGIDRWTNNGVGVKLHPLTSAQKKEVAELNKSLSKKK